MAVKLRLRRMGRKKRPVWAVVAADARSPRDGRYIEDLGRIYPLEIPKRVELKDERVMHWLRVGAQCTPTVRSLLSKRGLLLRHALEYKDMPESEIEAAVAAHARRHDEKEADKHKVTRAGRRAVALEQEAEAADKRARQRQEALARQKAKKAEKAAQKAAQQAEAAEA